MDSEIGQDLVVGASGIEGYATDDVVAILVGEAVEAQFLWCHQRGGDIGGYGGVVLVADAVLLGDIEGVAVDALVEGPVEDETVFRASELSVVVSVDFAFTECFRPEAHLVDESVEGAFFVVLHSTYAEMVLSIGECPRVAECCRGGLLVLTIFEVEFPL